MKTQIIQLEAHDDTLSVKDKMGWGQTPRILLVWPKNSRILSRRLDIVLLKRHSKFLGAQLAFITNVPSVCYHANRLDIPIYKSIQKAEKTHWRASRRRRRKGIVSLSEKKTNLSTRSEIRKDYPQLIELRELSKPRPAAWVIHPFTRFAFFTLGVLGVLAIVAVLIPNAEIRVSPQTQWQEIVFPVAASQYIETIDYSGVVPIRTVSIIVEGRGQAATSGEVLLPLSKATGNVIFTNLTDEEITIPVGTIVTSNRNRDARYKTQKQISIAAESKSDLIPVEAVEPGSEGNVLSNQLNAIEGPLGLDLIVTNPLGIDNGQDQVSPAPKDEDYDELKTETLQKLYQAAQQELKSRLGPEDIMLLADPENYQILQEVFTPAELQPADYLSLVLRVDFQADIVSGTDLETLAEYLLQANLPPNFSRLSTSDIEIEHQGIPTLINNETYQWDIEAKWQIGASIKEEDLIPHLLWQKPEIAVDRLTSQFPIKDNITYKIQPTWWPRLPVLPFRLDIITPN